MVNLALLVVVLILWIATVVSIVKENRRERINQRKYSNGNQTREVSLSNTEVPKNKTPNKGKFKGVNKKKKKFKLLKNEKNMLNLGVKHFKR